MSAIEGAAIKLAQSTLVHLMCTTLTKSSNNYSESIKNKNDTVLIFHKCNYVIVFRYFDVF